MLLHCGLSIQAEHRGCVSMLLDSQFLLLQSNLQNFFADVFTGASEWDKLVKGTFAL
jgi:hypothetical protein